MDKVDNLVLVGEAASIREAINVLDRGGRQIALVVDEQGHLLGTVTDGDVRRGILAGYALEAAVGNIMNRQAVTVPQSLISHDALLLRMEEHSVRQLPVLDDAGRVIGLHWLDHLLRKPKKSNTVVLMAGGLGSRLRPLTDDCPKPLLQVGGRPILETILESFVAHGFEHFCLAVNYKAEMIKQMIGDGSRWGVNIEYVHEDRRLGTAGALSLLARRPTLPILVMNADLLTKVDFDALLSFHQEHAAAATMCVREYEFQVPYGVVRLQDNAIRSIDEKPIQHYFVNAGIYVLEPETLDLIPRDQFFDMPTLFDGLLENRRKTVAFPIREYWADIGQVEDYRRANVEYSHNFRETTS